MGVKISVTRERDCPHNPLDREPWVSRLHREDAGEVKCVSIVRLMLKHFAIEPVCFTKAPLLMAGQR